MHPVAISPSRYELIEKRSRFITYCERINSQDEFKAFLQRLKHQYPDARHFCYGFRIGPLNGAQRGFSDDGEPSGTAGKPILAQLSGSGVGELTAVVTRYSGGIKLGTGGLVKAYGGGVQQALKLLQTIEKKITTKLRLELDYGFVPIAQSIMAQHQAVEVQADYGVQVEFIIEIELLQVDSFTQTMINKSGAKALVTKVKDN